MVCFLVMVITCSKTTLNITFTKIIGCFLGSYWKHQRKLITPTFHFNILEKFYEVFKEQGQILIEILKEKADGKTNIDIFPYMQSFALDVICGKSINL